MKKAIEINVHGIQCDNPGCDYANEDVQYDQFPEWVNKKCPKCGCNLLTQEDLDALHRVMELADLLNEKIGPVSGDPEPLKKITLKMDGTGNISTI